MVLLGQNQHGQWKHDPHLIRKKIVLGLSIGGVVLIALLIFLLIYLVVLNPPKPPKLSIPKEEAENETNSQKNEFFGCR